IVQSGSILKMGSPERTAQIAAAVLAELSLDKSQLDQLRSLPVDALVKAGVAAIPKTTAPPTPVMDIRKFADRMGWGPTVDQSIIPRHPFEPDAPEISANIPMMIGTTLNEFTTASMTPNAASMTHEAVAKRVESMWAGKGAQIATAFRDVTPNAKAFDI